MKLHGSFLFLLILTVAISCTPKNDRLSDLTSADTSVISGMINQYNTAWLRNDSAAILDLFADTAILIPSGIDPIQGKSNISAFWWPNDTSKSTIDEYKINVLEVHGYGNWAYTLEEGRLRWTYEKGATRFSREQKSYEITIFNKAMDQWKITRRLWTDQVLK